MILALALGKSADRVHQQLAVDIVLNGAQDKVLVGAENVGEQQLVSVPVGVERLVKADLGLLRRGLAQVHEYLIFNAARGVGRELDVLVAAVRVHCLDEPDRTDGDEVFDVDAGVFKPARDVGDKPQVVLNENLPALSSRPHPCARNHLRLPSRERRRERIAAADVKIPRRAAAGRTVQAARRAYPKSRLNQLMCPLLFLHAPYALKAAVAVNVRRNGDQPPSQVPAVHANAVAVKRPQHPAAARCRAGKALCNPLLALRQQRAQGALPDDRNALPQ